MKAILSTFNPETYQCEDKKVETKELTDSEQKIWQQGFNIGTLKTITRVQKLLEAGILEILNEARNKIEETE